MGRGGAKKVARRGFLAKAGVIFPVRRIQRYLKRHHLVNGKARVATGAALYMAAVLEYISAEVLELAGMAAIHNKKKRINPKWIWLAIKSDDEFRQLMKGSIMPESGNLWGPSATPSALGGNSPKTPAKMTSKVVKVISGKRGKNPVPLMNPSSSDGTGDAPLGGAVETLGRTLLSGVQLSVLKADITSVEADCYINPTNSAVGFGGQVGSRLSAVGGQALQDAIQPFVGTVIPECGALTTPARGLKARSIIHCNSPSWSDGNAIQKLEDTVKNCLNEACTGKFKSVAIPSIGSGGNQFPKQTAAQTILRTISDYFKNKPQTDFDVDKIIFVLFDKQSVNIYRTELGRLVE